jgi:bifunctional enzyme CysN/CysC
MTKHIDPANLPAENGRKEQSHQMNAKATNIFEVHSRIDRKTREDRNRHKGGVLWLTGLSGAGKSTLAVEVERALFAKGYHVYVLDGDNLRHGLNSNLGFSHEDRTENIRRVGEVAALFAEAGFVCVSAFISPYRADREGARKAAGDSFHEIHVEADLATCETRDPKGLYERARRGEIPDFTGISAPYEEPQNPELVVDTATQDVSQSVAVVLDYVSRNLTFSESNEEA